jgi:hypothetical protein
MPFHLRLMKTFFPPLGRKLSRETIKPRRYAIVSGVSPHSEENLMGKPVAYTANHKNLASYVGYNPSKRNAILNGVGILRRVFGALLKAMDESRQRQVEREIANYVALRGGRMTDSLEREIARRLFTSDWNRRE